MVELFLRSIQLCPDRVLLVNNVCRGLASLAKVSGKSGARQVATMEVGQKLAPSSDVHLVTPNWNRRKQLSGNTTGTFRF